MSVSSVGSGSIPNPASYSYPSDLPAGLASSSNATSQTASTGSQPAQSPYQIAYHALQIYDNEELLQVSFGSADNALNNVTSVLAQAAQYQEQQRAAQQQAAATQANTPPNIPDPNVPSVESVIGQSDQQAQAVINNYLLGPAGSSILSYQA